MNSDDIFVLKEGVLVEKGNHNELIARNGEYARFCQKLGISRASLFNLIGELKDYGIHIEYSRELQTYRYLYPDRVQIHISIYELPEKDEKNS